MSFINYSSREINCKLVYYGPGLCGKTTNLQYIYNKTRPEAKGKMISLATETERTLFFDFLPLSLGEIRGFKTRFHLYTVPGQVFYDASRKLILKGVDGVCFVADSQEERFDANIESLENLRLNLSEQGYDLDKLPYVVQYNKRDLPNAMSVADLNAQINPMGVPTHEGVAREGKGVFATLKEISKPGFFDTLSASTRSLVEGLTGAAREAGVPFVGDSEGGMFGFFFASELPQNYGVVMATDKERFNRFFHAMLDRGVYLAPALYEAGFVSAAHTAGDIAATVQAAREALRA